MIDSAQRPIISFIAAGLGLALLTGQSGCNLLESRPEFLEARIEREFEEGAARGEAHFQMMLTLREHEPALYQKFLDKIREATNNGGLTDERLMQVAAAIRPEVLRVFHERLQAADDTTINQLLDIGVETYQVLRNNDAHECVRNIQGLPPENVDVIPAGLQQREQNLLMSAFDVSLAGPNSIVSEEEAVSWMRSAFERNPHHAQGISSAQLNSPTETEAKNGCDAMIYLLDELRAKPTSEAAAYFRRISAMI